jgi:hypothetical protein
MTTHYEFELKDDVLTLSLHGLSLLHLAKASDDLMEGHINTAILTGEASLTLNGKELKFGKIIIKGNEDAPIEKKEYK